MENRHHRFPEALDASDILITREFCFSTSGLKWRSQTLPPRKLKVNRLLARKVYAGKPPAALCAIVTSSSSSAGSSYP